jgi:NADH-quinone oxidoreductase subunit L
MTPIVPLVGAATLPGYAPLLLLLPLFGFAFTAAVGRRLGKLAHLVPLGAIVVTWALAMSLAIPALTGGLGEGGASMPLFTWIASGDLHFGLGLHVDALTGALLLVVTTVGALVHLYSVGYMSHDDSYWRFFAYLNLFMFSMLLLVLADNLLVVFAAWELVGLSSYLLIGFWYTKTAPGLAAKKAFITNRVGDVGFILGLMGLVVVFGSLDIHTVLAGVEAGALAGPAATVIALLIFCGAVGKSAQFPLHVWLPDAMEGPTPVSALIHAATMVNAGVYLVARMSPLFAASHDAMLIVAAIGIFTAIFAASIAFTQTDIKRVLAFSTLSQLGYMFAALGVGAWVPAIFHLITHGFFKGLLFLGSGSVIHAVDGEQEMTKMGGLWRKIPITYATMLIGTVAIAGLPPLAGFWSKDEILGEAFKFGFTWVWLVGMVVAGMTAFYMFRLMGLTFWGKSRVHDDSHVHESPWTMTLPLIILAVPSIAIGAALGFPFANGILVNGLEPIFHPASVLLAHEHEAWTLFGIDGLLMLASVTVASIGTVIGVRLFRDDNSAFLGHFTKRLQPLYDGSRNRWYFDDLNDLVFVRFGRKFANALWWFDRRVVDGTVNGVATLTSSGGRGLRQIQTGRVQNYALGIAFGLVAIAAAYLVIAG